MLFYKLRFNLISTVCWQDMNVTTSNFSGIGFKNLNLAIDSSYVDIILFNVTFIIISLSVY